MEHERSVITTKSHSLKAKADEMGKVAIARATEESLKHTLAAQNAMEAAKTETEQQVEALTLRLDKAKNAQNPWTQFLRRPQNKMRKQRQGLMKQSLKPERLLQKGRKSITMQRQR